MKNVKNSNYINVQVKSTNDKGFKNSVTIGACTAKGTVQEDGQPSKYNTCFINLETLAKLTNSGELIKGDYLNCALSDNVHYTGENSIHTLLSGSAPITAATDNTSSSDYVKIRIKTKNEAGYQNEVIIGNITKKGTPLKNGVDAFADLMSINLATVRDLIRKKEISDKFLNMIIIPNKKCSYNYVVGAPAAQQPPKVEQQQQAPTMDDVPF